MLEFPKPLEVMNINFNSLIFMLKLSIDHAAHSAVVLKAESAADKAEWLSKLRNVIPPPVQVKGESGLTMRQSLSDGSLVSPSESFFLFHNSIGGLVALELPAYDLLVS